MGFVYLTLSTLWAVFVLMPINYYSNGWVDGVKPGETPGDDIDYMVMAKKKQPQDPLPVIPFPSIVTRDTLYENTQLLMESLESYFSDIHLDVEHVSILKDTQLLDKLLIRRAKKLQQLERAWFKWIGDEPVDNYHPDGIREQTLAFLEAPRPGEPPVVDATVQELRDSGFKDGHTAFVTFHNAWSSQIASQVVHYPVPGSMLTEPAMEPRDIIWMNEETNVWDRRVRQGVMTMLIGLLLTLTLSIDFVLATLVNVNEIREYLPWLGDMLNEHAWLRTFVQNSLPTLLLILINALIPVAMRYSTYFQRIRSHSRVDHSVLNNARDMLKELSQSPMHMIDKLAQSLPVARNFSLSYVVFQGLALQPFQLVLLPTILSQQLHHFGFAYVVLKYQLLNVLFQVFQLSLFSVRKQVINSLLIELFLPLTSYVNLYDIFTMDNESHLHVQEDDLSSRDADEPASNDMAQESFEPPLSWNHPGLLKT
ncbi:hypothetical protein MEQU1_001122 [Malassezia equina]|uniref:CSC1/OSCA1-like 7TM region domain-containing protein n=1 Tax=Malassezia equina TaxID=1381935 RepID=A0AAF0ED30_9BASI|nr:hypothetical protein MEQU1_001122 [Malassezia equina]